MSKQHFSVSVGTPSPLGPSQGSKGINFAFESGPSEKVAILLFKEGKKTPFFATELSADPHKTGSIWHACIEGLEPSFEYTYKTLQNDNWSTELLDPYAKAISSSIHWNPKKKYAPKARYFAPQSFDWEQIEKPKTPFKDWIIYEMHVRGFSKHPSSHAKSPGTFLEVIEKIPYLKSLGITAVELLPVFEFNECEQAIKNPQPGKQLFNFWGYSTVHFFSPMQRYASSEQWSAPILEFKQMVKELHRNRIAVILDVVYNHTAEHGDDGIVQSFKGLDNAAYYILSPEGKYCNYSGTGNSFNCNHPIALKFIIDSLVYWTQEMQVDGFRFDLASILTRGENGEPLESPPLLEAMHNEPLLKNTHFIAEPWDAAGLYQVGSFPGKHNWAEWNGQYRDTCREFIKGTPGQSGAFAQALCGSQNLYRETSPIRSVNFITAHDGYTLSDLVSYQEKHNLANREDNRDGTDQHLSWNCGVEGNTDNQKILHLRQKQMKNFIVTLMVSLGVPMLLMGDEYAHTRHGNNNPYCQDNELNWFLWDQLEKNKDFFSFVQKVIAFRKQHKKFFCKEYFLSDQDITWHGRKANSPDWDSEYNFIAYSLKSPRSTKQLFICFNAGHEDTLIKLPSLPKQHWKQIIDTSLKAPYDFIEKETDRPLLKKSYILPAYSSLVAESS